MLGGHLTRPSVGSEMAAWAAPAGVHQRKSPTEWAAEIPPPTDVPGSVHGMSQRGSARAKFRGGVHRVGMINSFRHAIVFIVYIVPGQRQNRRHALDFADLESVTVGELKQHVVGLTKIPAPMQVLKLDGRALQPDERRIVECGATRNCQVTVQEDMDAPRYAGQRSNVRFATASTNAAQPMHLVGVSRHDNGAPWAPKDGAKGTERPWLAMEVQNLNSQDESQLFLRAPTLLVTEYTEQPVQILEMRAPAEPVYRPTAATRRQVAPIGEGDRRERHEVTFRSDVSDGDDDQTAAVGVGKPSNKASTRAGGTHENVSNTALDGSVGHYSQAAVFDGGWRGQPPLESPRRSLAGPVQTVRPERQRRRRVDHRSQEL